MSLGGQFSLVEVELKMILCRDPNRTILCKSKARFVKQVLTSQYLESVRWWVVASAQSAVGKQVHACSTTLSREFDDGTT